MHQSVSLERWARSPRLSVEAAGAQARPALWIAGTRAVVPPAPRSPTAPCGATPAPPDRLFAAGAGELKAALQTWIAAPDQTIVALRDELTLPAAVNLLAAIRHALRVTGRLLLVQAGAGGMSMIQTLCREEPSLDGSGIEIAPTPAAVATARRFAAAPEWGWAELSVDSRGTATVTRWVQAALPTTSPPFRPGEAVVVSGGLGGLGRAVAIHLGRRLGVHPVVLDRVAPGSPRTVRALAELGAARLPYTHVVADVTDAAAVWAALRPVLAARPVRGVVHCAGLVEGGHVRTLAAADLLRLAAPKVAGLRAILTALDPGQLRVVLAFGSILARHSHPGMGAYALANELLRREVIRCARLLPGPRYLTAEWSVWDGAGVAAETGAAAVARQIGYQPIELAEGLRIVERLLAWTGPTTSVVVSASPPPEPPGAPTSPYRADVKPFPRGDDQCPWTTLATPYGPMTRTHRAPCVSASP